MLGSVGPGPNGSSRSEDADTLCKESAWRAGGACRVGIDVRVRARRGRHIERSGLQPELFLRPRSHEEHHHSATAVTLPSARQSPALVIRISIKPKIRYTKLLIGLLDE